MKKRCNYGGRFQTVAVKYYLIQTVPVHCCGVWWGESSGQQSVFAWGVGVRNGLESEGGADFDFCLATCLIISAPIIANGKFIISLVNAYNFTRECCDIAQSFVYKRWLRHYVVKNSYRVGVSPLCDQFGE